MRENFPTQSARWEGTRIHVSQLRLRLARKRESAREAEGLLQSCLSLNILFRTNAAPIYHINVNLKTRTTVFAVTLGDFSDFRRESSSASSPKWSGNQTSRDIAVWLMCTAWILSSAHVSSLIRIISNSQLGAVCSILHFDLLFAVHAKTTRRPRN